jgi:hypothetical protein
VRPDDETAPGDWSIDTDTYSDDSYDHPNSPKLSPTDWYDQTAPNIYYQAKASTEFDNLTTPYLVNQLTISKPNLPTGLADRNCDLEYEWHKNDYKVNRLKDHKLHDDDNHVIYVLLQPTLYMPKPKYPTIFKSTANSHQNWSDSVPSDIEMNIDYNMPPPLIKNEPRLFNPSALDNGSILFNIDSLAMNPINHDDELVPGTMLSVPILNDWDTDTSDAENDTATATISTSSDGLRMHWDRSV